MGFSDKIDLVGGAGGGTIQRTTTTPLRYVDAGTASGLANRAFRENRKSHEDNFQGIFDAVRSKVIPKFGSGRRLAPAEVAELGRTIVKLMAGIPGAKVRQRTHPNGAVDIAVRSMMPMKIGKLGALAPDSGDSDHGYAPFQIRWRFDRRRFIEVNRVLPLAMRRHVHERFMSRAGIVEGDTSPEQRFYAAVLDEAVPMTLPMLLALGVADGRGDPLPFALPCAGGLLIGITHHTGVFDTGEAMSTGYQQEMNGTFYRIVHATCPNIAYPTELARSQDFGHQELGDDIDAITSSGGGNMGASAPSSTTRYPCKGVLHVGTFVDSDALVPEQERLEQRLRKIYGWHYTALRDAAMAMYAGMIGEATAIEAIRPCIMELRELIASPLWRSATAMPDEVRNRVNFFRPQRQTMQSMTVPFQPFSSLAMPQYQGLVAMSPTESPRAGLALLREPPPPSPQDATVPAALLALAGSSAVSPDPSVAAP